MEPTVAPWAQKKPPKKDVVEGGVEEEKQEKNLAKVKKALRLPKKRITCAEDVEKWNETKAFRLVVQFISDLNGSVLGKKLSHECHMSKATSNLCKMLTAMENWIEEIPPVNQPMRFGNKAFRTWHGRLVQEAASFIHPLLSDDANNVAKENEIIGYLLVSFGDLQRIDYGTGHELSFVAFLCCLSEIGIFKEADRTALVFKVFHSYLKLMRHLQMTYWLEPAGSRGVWGLDDYQFLPFIWGASQLIENETIRPSMVTDDSVLDQHSEEYLYLECVAFIKKVKSGLFAEHSPILNDITAVPLWKKVNKGLMKMYNDKVLHKFPVVQHFLFGSILSYDKFEVPK